MKKINDTEWFDETQIEQYKIKQHVVTIGPHSESYNGHSS